MFTGKNLYLNNPPSEGRLKVYPIRTMSDPIYFISDAHLGAASQQAESYKTERLLPFLRGLRGRTKLLYIVGDLFDFWFEYRTVILKQHFAVLHELAGLAESGTRIVYLAGNHDFWLGSFLDEQVGVETVYGQLEVSHQGKKMLICHGDGLISKDWNYRLMRKILHNRLNIWLFQWIHPDVAVWLARTISGASRRHAAPSSWSPVQAYRELAKKHLKERYDCVVFGHVHKPDLQKEGDKIYLNLGDWVRFFTFGIMVDGELRLESLEDTETP